MRALPLLVGLLTTVSLASADPAAKAPLSAADAKAYAAQLTKGRKLENAGKHADAIAAFEAGLKSAPDDATLLGEIGASAYLAKDLAKAETATRAAIKNASAPNIRGASLYNLGRIQEDKKDTAGAILSYIDSLRARPNSVVRARLAKLDPKAAAALDPYKPVPLAGPFASLDAYCKTVPAATDADMVCSCGVETDVQDKPVTAAAYDVQLFASTCGYHGTDYHVSDFKLGVKVGASWYVAPVAHEEVSRHCALQYKLGDAKPQDLAAASGSEVVARYTIDGECWGGMVEESWSEERLVLVGTGASKVPSATPPLLRKRLETTVEDRIEHPDAKKTTANVALEFTWKPDGTFTVAGKTTGIDATEAGGLLGKHAITFP